ncbi:2Fe-2S iron-sulfur cluster-binding protein [Streptomyces sp. NBC_01108]|uniref:(2Fe-2S)-binding protein n=1 Tax=Streptomyces sp. NBC_01108 TaxID=2903751 RepID=UPI003873814E|nr:2Fe-2S iron-sulfur cluster-binding protein [Streptomyces sp. NBC_01108]
MSNEDHNEHHGQREQPQHGGWQPTPQGGEYDAEATAFVHLPPEDLANIPLAAPGQGYVPPMIVPLTPAAGLDPSATGSWVVQTQSQQERAAEPEQPAPGAVHWPDPNQQQTQYGYEYPQQDQYRETPDATGQWNFTEPTAFAQQADHAAHVDHTEHGVQPDHGGHTDHTAHVGHTEHGVQPDHGGHTDRTAHTTHTDHTDHVGHTGQWTIPVADGDLPEESGEFAASALASQWYADRTPPATLPGGAPAPWATQQPVAEPEPEPAPAVEPAPGADIEPEHAPGADFAPVMEPVAELSEAYSPLLSEMPSVASSVASSVAYEAPPPETSAEDGPVPAAGDAGDAGDAGGTPVLDADLAQALAPHTAVPDDAPAEHPGEQSPTDTPLPNAPLEAPPLEAELSEGQPPESRPSESQSSESQPLEVQPSDTRPVDLPSEHPAASYVLHVNGADRPVTDAWIGESLLYVLRERLGLAGAKDGCSQGECGACNVQVDGRLVASCLVPAATAAGSEVRTVEGLAVDGEPSDVQRALAKCGAVQCGFCIPGMAMTVHDLLEGNHAPSELETRQALCGNLCRCSGYRGVLDAVNEVIAGREASADPAASSDSSSPESDEARIPHQAAPGAGRVQPHSQDGGMA